MKSRKKCNLFLVTWPLKYVAQKTPGEDAAGLVKEVYPGLRDLQALKVQRAILVKPSQLLLSYHPPPTPTVVNETDVASFQCKVRGNPKPQITWLKQNSSLPANKRIVQSRGTLIIRDVTPQDGGMYTCQAKNLLAVVTSSAILTVQGK